MTPVKSYSPVPVQSYTPGAKPCSPFDVPPTAAPAADGETAPRRVDVAGAARQKAADTWNKLFTYTPGEDADL